MLTFFLLIGGGIRIAKLNTLFTKKETEKFNVEKNKSLIVNLTIFITLLQTLLFIPTFLTYVNGSNLDTFSEINNQLKILGIVTILSGLSILIAFFIKNTSFKYFFVIGVIVSQIIINSITYYLFKIQLGGNEIFSIITTFLIIFLLLQEKRFKNMTL